MTDVTVYIAHSIDGYIADRDGSIAWLAPFDGVDYGYEAFVARIDALVMGAGTYRDCRAFAEWPYRGKAVIVMTKSGRLDEDGLAVFDYRTATEIYTTYDTLSLHDALPICRRRGRARRSSRRGRRCSRRPNGRCRR
jgi:dihydrofolate reductase